MKCVITVSGDTSEGDLSQANIVLSCLGDPGGEICQVLANRTLAWPSTYFTVDDLEQVPAISEGGRS